jgi:hypothetical protein
MIKGSGSVPLTNGSGSRRPKTHTDPTDPDPQHWLELLYIPLHNLQSHKWPWTPPLQYYMYHLEDLPILQYLVGGGGEGEWSKLLITAKQRGFLFLFFF